MPLPLAALLSYGVTPDKETGPLRLHYTKQR